MSAAPACALACLADLCLSLSTHYGSHLLVASLGSRGSAAPDWKGAYGPLAKAVTCKNPGSTRACQDQSRQPFDREPRNLGRAKRSALGLRCASTHAVPAVHTDYVEAPPAARIWRPWTIWLPCVLAFLWSGFLIFGDVIVTLASLLNDNTEPQTGWVYPAVIGHCVLAGASVLALRVGLRSPSRRRAAAVAAWMIIPVGLGWPR